MERCLLFCLLQTMLKDPNRSSRPPTTAYFRSATATSNTLTTVISDRQSAVHDAQKSPCDRARGGARGRRKSRDVGDRRTPELMTSRQVRRLNLARPPARRHEQFHFPSTFLRA